MTAVDISAVLPGDVVLSRGGGFVDKAIRRCEERRYGTGSPYAWANHAALIVTGSPVARIIEAQSRGVVVSSLFGYPDEFTVLRPDYAAGQAAAAVARMRAMVGDKYGYVEIACLALALWTGTRLRFGMQGQAICSGAVSVALVGAGYDLSAPATAKLPYAVGDDPEWNTPADLLRVASAHSWTWVAGVQLVLPA